MDNRVEDRRQRAGTAILTIILFLILGILGIQVWSAIFVPRIVDWGDASEQCWLDHIQNFSMARAVLAGDDPYQPIGEIFGRYFPAISCNGGPVMVPESSPYPPASILLFLPFVSLVDKLDQSVLLWNTFSALLLLVSIWRHVALFTSSWIRRANASILVFICVLGTGAIYQDLWLGNMQTFLLALVLEMLAALRHRKERFAGVILGILLAVKITGIPLLLYLLFRKRFRILLPALMTAIGLTLLVGIVFGMDTLAAYPKAAMVSFGIFGHQSMNLSLLLIGHRLFGDLLSTPDLVDIFGVSRQVPVLVLSFSPLLCEWIGRTVVVVLFGVFLFCKREMYFTGAIMMGLTAACQPVVWHYTQSLILPALALLLILLYQVPVSRTKWVCSGVSIFFVIIPPSRWLQAMGIFTLSPYLSSMTYLLDSLVVPLLLIMLKIIHPSRRLAHYNNALKLAGSLEITPHSKHPGFF